MDQPMETTYQRIEQRKDQVLTKVIGTVSQIKNNVKMTKEQLRNQDQLMDRINKRLDNMQKKVVKTNRRMEDYLNRTSDCCLYIIVGIQLLVFILLMSI